MQNIYKVKWDAEAHHDLKVECSKGNIFGNTLLQGGYGTTLFIKLHKASTVINL